MTFRSLSAAAVAAFFLTAVGGAQASSPSRSARHVAEHYPPVTVTVPAARIVDLRQRVWSCQQRASIPSSRASLDPRTVASASVAYRAWVAGLWAHRLAACRVVLARTLPSTNDWQTAVRVVQRVYPGSSWWLLSCSSSEGGHGAFVLHDPYAGSYVEHGETVRDTPGGQMQYFPGTFWHDLDAAVVDLREHGVRVPRSAFSWYSAIGQAIAAGWAYGHDRPSGKWTGSGC